MTRELVCTVCPLSCKVIIGKDEKILNPGASCKKGKKYAIAELKDPRRVFTSTVWVAGGKIKRVPARTSRPIKKEDWQRAAKIIGGLRVAAPISFKQVLIKDFLEEGIHLVATREICHEKDDNRC